MLFPQITSLVDSYSSFKNQIRYHLPRKAFPAHPSPPARPFEREALPPSAVLGPGHSCYSLGPLSWNYFPATKPGGGARGARSLSNCQKLAGSKPPGELHRHAYSWRLAPDLQNLHCNKPRSQVIAMHFENHCIRV